MQMSEVSTKVTSEKRCEQQMCTQSCSGSETNFTIPCALRDTFSGLEGHFSEVRTLDLSESSPTTRVHFDLLGGGSEVWWQTNSSVTALANAKVWFIYPHPWK